MATRGGEVFLPRARQAATLHVNAKGRVKPENAALVVLFRSPMSRRSRLDSCSTLILRRSITFELFDLVT